jgi:hypothetical protein
LTPASVNFYSLSDEQKKNLNLTFDLELPKGRFKIDASEREFQTPSKGSVYDNEDDQAFFYKNHENFIVLKFKIPFSEDFKLEDQKDQVIGF